MTDDVLKRLRAAIKRKEAELEELRQAEKVLSAYNRAYEPKAPPKILEGSIKAEIMDLLAEFPSGLTANAILAKLQEGALPDLIRTSLSPQLSRLKREGRLEYADKKWKILKWEGVMD